MKKITSFLMMAVLCCIGAFAQETVGSDIPTDKVIKIGTSQAALVPGQWYFVHNSRPSSGAAQNFTIPGETVPAFGGFVTDMGAGQTMRMSSTEVVNAVSSEEGVSANDYLKHMVRFVAVEGKEEVYKIEFATGNWMGGNPNTITKNQHIAGESGEYNFYLVEIAGVDNALGRFAWNKFDMANRVDNNGAGNTVSFWDSGITSGETHEWTSDEQITGNKIWQIYDIQILGDVDKYDESLQTLLDNYTTVGNQQDGNFVGNLQEGQNVGTAYGNFRAEDVEAFLAQWTIVEEAIFLWEDDIDALMAMYPTSDDIKALNEAFVKAYNHMIENKIPMSMTNIEPGYYTVNSMLNWYETKKDTIFLTQEEADSVNGENGYMEGDEGYVEAGGIKEITSSQVPAPIKALCSRDDNGQGKLAWGTLEPKAEYLWKIEKVEGKPTEYRFINMYRNTTFMGISQSGNAQLVVNDTTTISFDWRGDNGVAPVTGDTVTYFNIRNASQAENGYNYLHCGGHSGGAGTGSWIVGWSDGGATQWYLSSVDDATAEEWMAEGNVAVVLASKITKGDSIVAAVPGQIEIAKDIETLLNLEDSVVVTADQFYSQYTTEDAQTIPEGQTIYDFLIDGKQNTYWHSAWEAGSVGQKVHYLQINANEELNGLYAVKLQRRPVSGDHITQLIVKGYTEEPTDETTFEEGTELGVLDFPLSSNNETLTSKVFDATGMSYLRFYSTTTATTGGGGANRGYWHASAFNVYPATANKRFDTVQYDVRKELADNLEAAAAVWTEKAFDVDSLALATDPTFEEAYNALVAAYEAWSAVFVDPADLRAAIAAAPSEDLFVIGNNPGQWQEGVVTPATAVAAAEAYNAAGTYTPAESQAHIDAIAAAEESVFDAANKVKTGVWYSFKFAAEETYDKFGWDKTGPSAYTHPASQIETSPALFDRVVATGIKGKAFHGYTTEEGETDTISNYFLEIAEYTYEGDEVYYMPADEEFEYGENLFRFVEATDSSYLIQHKASGLYLRTGHPVTLSANPSYFDVKAIGAGATIVGSTDIFGNRANPLHAERATSRLVTWNATTLASNSMMFIEERGSVTDEPTNNFEKKLWPGAIYALTYPVDINIAAADGATAYGAKLNVTETDTTVVLMTIEAETIKAGTPFLMIADTEGEYISAADRLKEIQAIVTEEDGMYSDEQAEEARIRRDDEYAKIALAHGTQVDTLTHELGDLRATMKSTPVEAGKAILVNGENGFKHTVVNATVGAFSAYIVANFDPETEDVVKGIEILVDGSIETGINEAIETVAKSGNIYTVGGQLVGKGNINTVNNLPAGVYIVNGVKVIKH